MHSYEYTEDPTPLPMQVATIFCRGEIIDALNLLIEKQNKEFPQSPVARIPYYATSQLTLDKNNELKYSTLKTNY